MPTSPSMFEDDFDAPELDSHVWIASYLPMWSSRAASAATYALADSELRLTIPTGHPLWCRDEHPPLRVSGVQSGIWSGEVGSTRGQQPFRDGLVVREFQPAQSGLTPHLGRVEVRARMELSPRSMASVWMVGLEDEPERCGEICVFEVFGDAPRAVGAGIHPFRDPALTDDFAAPELDIDVARHHVYGVDWRPGHVDFDVDGRHVRSVAQAPGYPLQLMVAVFDFPEKAGPEDHVPELAVDRIRWTP